MKILLGGNCIIEFLHLAIQVSGEQGNAVWRSVEHPPCSYSLALSVFTFLFSSQGVQVGGLQSSFGVLGAWTTIFHDDDDPVGALPHLNFNSWRIDIPLVLGPFWLRRQASTSNMPMNHVSGNAGL